MQKVEGSNPFSRSPESLAFAGLSEFLAGPPGARLGHFPRLLSLHCLNRGFLAPPGGPPRACDPASETASTWPRAALAAPGRWGPSAARSGAARVLSSGGARLAPRKEPEGLVGRATQHQLKLLGVRSA